MSRSGCHAIINQILKSYKLKFFNDYRFKKIEEIQEENFLVSFESCDFYVTGPLNMLLIRDAFNWSASHIKYFKTWPLKIWKKHAKEYLNMTNKLPNKICINYNKWFRSKQYRDQLSNRLNVDFNYNLNKVSNYAGGSSFDELKYQNNAQKMQVLNRFKYLKKHPKVVQRLLRKDIIELSEKIDKQSCVEFINYFSNTNHKFF